MKNILTPLDFSEESISALKIAAQIANKENAKIILSHAIEIPDYSDASTETDESYKAELLKAVNTKIDQILNGEDISIPGSSIHIEFGHPFKHIQKLIISERIDLIVMGSRGAKHWERQMIGSNTDKVVRRAECPVLIVNNSIDIDKIKDIVFATDLANTPIFITTALKELQQLFGARLHILKVVTPGQWATEPEIKKQVEQFVELHSLTNYTMRIYNDVEVEHGIVHYSRDIDAGLVAMASHTKVYLPSLIQDDRTTERVVENCRHLVWTCGLGDRIH